MLPQIIYAYLKVDSCPGKKDRNVLLKRDSRAVEEGVKTAGWVRNNLEGNQERKKSATSAAAASNPLNSEH